MPEQLLEAQKRSKPLPKLQIQTQAFPQKNPSLIKPLLKTAFPQFSKALGQEEAPFHFSRFVCWVHYCSKLCQSSPWKPEGKQAFSKIAKFKLQAFPKGYWTLIKPLLKNSFSTFSKALDQERLHFTLVGLFAGFTIAASCAEQPLEAQKRSKPFPKAIAKFKLQAFPKGANPLLNPY